MLSLYELLARLEGSQPVAMQFSDGPVTTTRPAAEILADALGEVLEVLPVRALRVKNRYLLIEMDCALQ